MAVYRCTVRGQGPNKSGHSDSAEEGQGVPEPGATETVMNAWRGVVRLVFIFLAGVGALVLVGSIFFGGSNDNHQGGGDTHEKVRRPLTGAADKYGLNRVARHITKADFPHFENPNNPEVRMAIFGTFHSGNVLTVDRPPKSWRCLYVKSADPKNRSEPWTLLYNAGPDIGGTLADYYRYDRRQKRYLRIPPMGLPMDSSTPDHIGIPWLCRGGDCTIEQGVMVGGYTYSYYGDPEDANQCKLFN